MNGYNCNIEKKNGQHFYSLKLQNSLVHQEANKKCTVLSVLIKVQPALLLKQTRKRCTAQRKDFLVPVVWSSDLKAFSLKIFKFFPV